VRTLRDWNEGDNAFNNEHHQQAVLALRELDARDAYDGLTDYRAAQWFPALIVAEGPDGQADYSDERYWLKVQYLQGAGGGGTNATPLATSDELSHTGDPTIVTGHNLAERPAHSHVLKTDGSVLVMVQCWFDYGNPQRKRYLFTFGGAMAVRYGVLANPWPEFPDHNKVTLTPCEAEDDDTPLTDPATGDPLPNVTAYVQTPIDSTPPFYAVNAGQVVAYYASDAGNNVLLHCPAPTSDTLYDLIQVTAVVGGKGTMGAGPLKAQ
jgi:hypothetical protein